MAIRLRESDEGGSWMVFTDLTVGLFTLFVLAYLTMAALKRQTESEFTRKEEEVQSCEEKFRKVAKERNALLALSLKTPLEQGLIALEEGNIQIQASLLFPTGQAKLTGSGREVIRQIGRGLLEIMDTANVIMVSGFTDDTPISSKTYTNWELSAERATTVVRALVSDGFPPSRIFAAGFGEHHPRFPNTTAQNRMLNRRVEISLAPMSGAGLMEDKRGNP